MGIGYTAGKLTVAIESLLTSAKPIQDRLSGAVLTTVTANPGFLTAMPEEARQKYEVVADRLSRHLPESREPNRGLIADNARCLRDDEAAELVEAFWECHRIVARAEAVAIAKETMAKAITNIVDACETEATRDRTADFDVL